MSALLPFLALDQTCEQALVWVIDVLHRTGFRVVQTFDLQIARLTHPDCTCPHHDADQCDCQMVVLLVYRKHEDPITLVIHGQDSKTWLSLANPIVGHTNQQLEVAIRRALAACPPNLISPIEVANEARSTV